MSRGRQVALRVLSLAVGLALTAYVVSSLGLARVGEALRDAAPWMPLVVLLEVGIIVTDVLAIRALVGERAGAIRRSTWIRSTGLAYALGILLPAGRATGEAARAAALRADIGLPTAASAGARLQTASLCATGLMSLAGGAAVLGLSSPLAIALAANGLLCATLAAVVLFAARWTRLTTWLKKRLSPMADAAVLTPGALQKAIAFCGLGRVIQAFQYGTVLHAVGGVTTPRSALVAQGVHIIGATVGDAIPNQLGVTEGAYRVFADVVGLAAEPARAVSIALCVRAAQLSLAAVGWTVATFSRGER